MTVTASVTKTGRRLDRCSRAQAHWHRRAFMMIQPDRGGQSPPRPPGGPGSNRICLSLGTPPEPEIPSEASAIQGANIMMAKPHWVFGKSRTLVLGPGPPGPSVCRPLMQIQKYFRSLDTSYCQTL